MPKHIKWLVFLLLIIVLIVGIGASFWCFKDKHYWLGSFMWVWTVFYFSLRMNQWYNINYKKTTNESKCERTSNSSL